MAVDEKFVNRVRKVLESKGVKAVEKRMFGGVAFMVNGKMCVGIMNTGHFMARMGKEQNEAALKMPHAMQMSMKSKVMIGYIDVGLAGVERDEDLEKWVEMCLEFNERLEKK